MKKNRLFLFISILILLILFGTAAICNLCGITPNTEITTTADGQNSTTETASGATQSQETTKQTTAGESGADTKPTVNIVRIYGPIKEGDFYVQRFKANTAGLPKPAIKWNHDDSSGSFGKDVAQVNLKSGEEFDLKVTVTNSAGSASATMHIKYDLPAQPSETTQTVSFTVDPKSGPAGTEVKLNLSAAIDSPVETYYNGQKLSWYIFTKTASPDGKTLKETIPVGAGSGYFELKYDGKSVKAAEQFIVTTQIVSFTFDPKSGPGGTDVKLNLSEPITSSATVFYNGQELPKSVSQDGKTFIVTIPVGAGSGYFKIFYDGKNVQAAEQFTVPIAYNKSMPATGGTIASNGQAEGHSVYVGDTNTNLFCLGFVSFDITELKGGIISHAVLSFTNRQVVGDPTFYGPLFVNSLYWGGTKQINLSDISSQGTIIPSIFEGGGTPSNSQDNSLNYSVEPFLQNAINAGQENFQVRIQFTGNITDNDGVDDGWYFSIANISLVVSTVN